jgi:hypothetical protein
MAGFVLNEKGELYAAIGTAAASLTTSEVQNLASFKTRKVPQKVTVEDAGGGMVAGTLGQELLYTGYWVEYEGKMFLREYTVPGTDTTRPNCDIWLRAGGFLPGVHSTSPNAITYDMALADNGEALNYRYRESDAKLGRKLHDITAGKHGLNIKFIAGQGIFIEIVGGMALTYSDPGNVTAANAPPSMTLNDGTSVIPYLGATTALLQVSGSTYSGKIREVNMGIPTRTEMLPDGDSPSGFSQAFSNTMAPTFDLLVYEKNEDLQIRDAWSTADAHFDLSLATSGPAASGNVLSSRVFFDIENVAEEAGPAGVKALRVTGKPLWADRTTAFTTPGQDPSLPPFQLVWTTT